MVACAERGPPAYSGKSRFGLVLTAELWARIADQVEANGIPRASDIAGQDFATDLGEIWRELNMGFQPLIHSVMTAFCSPL